MFNHVLEFEACRMEVDMLDFSITDSQLQLQKEVRDFAQNDLLPAVWHYDREDKFPQFLLTKAYEKKIMNADLPIQYGGRGIGRIEGTIITEEIAAVCPGLATSIFDNSLGFEPLLLCENQYLKNKYLPLIGNENKYISFALSEVSMGSDVSGLQCKAERKGNDYILNGRKFWITNGAIADYFIVFATFDKNAKELGICAFLVEREWEGVTVGEHIPKLGQKTSNTVGIKFDNVLIPSDNILAEPPKGFLLAMKTFQRTRPIIGAFAVGASRTAMGIAIDYSKNRKTFGSKIYKHQMIQKMIADMYQKIETSRLLVRKAAWEVDRGMDATASASMAKVYATESAQEVINDAMQILGAYGYTSFFPLEKLLRDIRLFTIYEGTSEIQRKILAAHAVSAYRPAMMPIDKIPMVSGLDLDNEKDKNRKAWRCKVCGYVYYGDEAPKECPVCLYPGTVFKDIWPV